MPFVFWNYFNDKNLDEKKYLTENCKCVHTYKKDQKFKSRTQLRTKRKKVTILRDGKRIELLL